MAGAHGVSISPTTVMVVEPIILVMALVTVFPELAPKTQYFAELFEAVREELTAPAEGEGIEDASD